MRVEVRRNPSRRDVDLTAAFDVSNARIERAARAVAAVLVELGVPFALAGGVAVGAHGYPRATADVDFLVGDNAFDTTRSGLVTLRAGLPFETTDGVKIDYLSPATAPEVEALESAPGSASGVPISAGLPVVPIEVLFLQKLRAGRARDIGDLVELLKAGAPVDMLHDVILAHAPEWLNRWKRVVLMAEDEWKSGR